MSYIPEMSRRVTEGEFHGTHDAASHFKERVQKEDIKTWDMNTLRQALSALGAGLSMNALETGPDAGFAPSYREEERAVEDEIERRQ